MARYIRGQEKEGDLLIIELAALLHDISDPKFNGGDEERGMKLAMGFLEKQGLDPGRIAHIGKIIRHISFKGGQPQEEIDSPEFLMVQDADRLDAMGAIGIARAFSYGGHAGRKLYDPDIPPNPRMSKSEYKKSEGPTINHFYEKLLLLKDRMHTDAGKKLAEDRHQFMLDYLEEFYREWNGSA